jgi:hypothetical protein
MKKGLEPIILCGGRLHLPGEPAVLGNALSFREFRGFNRFFRITGHWAAGGAGFPCHVFS